MKNVKKNRFSTGFTKGVPKESETFNVSYSYSLSDGSSECKKIQIETKGGPKAAGRRVVQAIKRKFPEARITIRRIWKPGMTPGGLHLPSGTEWIDSEVSGKGKVPR